MLRKHQSLPQNARKCISLQSFLGEDAPRFSYQGRALPIFLPTCTALTTHWQEILLKPLNGIGLQCSLYFGSTSFIIIIQSLGCFPFIRTGRPDPSVCKENATIWRNTCIVVPHILLEKYIRYHPLSVLIRSPSKCPDWPVSSVKWKASLVRLKVVVMVIALIIVNNLCYCHYHHHH